MRTPGLEIEFVPVSQRSLNNRNTNHHPHLHLHQFLSALLSSTSRGASNEKVVRQLGSLFPLTQRHNTYFPGRRSTFSPLLSPPLSPPRLHRTGRLAPGLVRERLRPGASCHRHASNQPGLPMPLKRQRWSWPAERGRMCGWSQRGRITGCHRTARLQRCRWLATKLSL